MSILFILGQLNSQESVQSALILPSTHFQNVAIVSTSGSPKWATQRPPFPRKHSSHACISVECPGTETTAKVTTAGTILSPYSQHFHPQQDT